jgi:acyl dehydratase
LDVDVRTLSSRLGEDIAVSEWVEITQERINTFAEASGDHQWIHVDADRAAASPFGSTIAHGFLTLSLVSVLARSAMAFPGVGMSINYGLNRVRFPAPVPVGSRIRAHFAVHAVEALENAVQITWSVTTECDRSTKPCCVAEWVVRYYT